MKTTSMRLAITGFALLFGLIPAWSQSPPTVEIPPGRPPAFGPVDESIVLRGTVIAYDWSTRYYMEGARIENFIFKAADDTGNPKIVRVVLLWHPADSRRILPNAFYLPGKVWSLTLRSTSPFDFVRQYCITLDAPTFVVDIGDGKKARLRRYVSPTVLPPDTDLTTNFKTAIATRPNSPEMPDTTSMRCMYLERVGPAQR